MTSGWLQGLVEMSETTSAPFRRMLFRVTNILTRVTATQLMLPGRPARSSLTNRTRGLFLRISRLDQAVPASPIWVILQIQERGPEWFAMDKRPGRRTLTSIGSFAP